MIVQSESKVQSDCIVVEAEEAGSIDPKLENREMRQQQIIGESPNKIGIVHAHTMLKSKGKVRVA